MLHFVCLLCCFALKNEELRLNIIIRIEKTFHRKSKMSRSTVILVVYVSSWHRDHHLVSSNHWIVDLFFSKLYVDVSVALTLIQPKKKSWLTLCCAMTFELFVLLTLEVNVYSFHDSFRNNRARMISSFPSLRNKRHISSSFRKDWHVRTKETKRRKQYRHQFEGKRR